MDKQEAVKGTVLEEPAEAVELKKALKLLSDERVKHEKAVRECSGQRRKLKKSFNDMKQSRKKKVDEILEENFLDQSEKGLVDKVLTRAIKEPKLHQLQDSISKLEDQEEWHRKKLAEISKEEAKKKGSIRKLEAMEVLQECRKSYLDWYDSFMACEESWHNFKDLVRKVHSHNLDYKIDLDVAGISDPIFSDLLRSRMRVGVLDRLTQNDLVSTLSGIYLIKENPWYRPSSRYDERRIKRKSVDPRRDSWS